jgi:hypothetical protein
VNVLDLHPQIISIKAPQHRYDEGQIKSLMAQVQVADIFCHFQVLNGETLNNLDEMLQEEVFYACKLGTYIDGIDSKVWYVFSKLHAIYGSANKVMDVFPSILYERAFNMNISLQNFICENIQTDYRPLSMATRIVRQAEHYDVFVQSLNAVIMLPHFIGEKLTHSDTFEIQLRGDTLYLGKRQLKYLAGDSRGVSDVYDYRKLTPA